MKQYERKHGRLINYVAKLSMSVSDPTRKR